MKKAITLLTTLAASAGLALADSHSKKDIVDIAAGSEDFATLVAAVKAAGLVDTLKGDGPYAGQGNAAAQTQLGLLLD